MTKTTRNNEAKLIELGNKLAKARVAWDKALEREAIAEKQYTKLVGRRPEPNYPKPPRQFAKQAKTATYGDRNFLRECAPDHPLVTYFNAWDAAFSDPEYKKQWKAYLKKCRRSDQKVGLSDAKAENEKWVRDTWRLGEKIFAMKAHTPVGQIVKIRALGHLSITTDDIDDPFNELKPVTSLITDIKALAQSA